MRLNRIFVDQPLRTGTEIELEPQAAHHLTRVLRLRSGAGVRVFDGRGDEFEATLTSATRQGARIAIGQTTTTLAESPLAITLAQGVSRGERMDLVMQKATELGVTRIAPLITERSVVRLDPERAHKRHEHWRRILIGAAEQSGRSRLPELHEICAFADWLTSLPAGGTRLLLQPDAATHPRALAPDDAVTIAIGPEGGFSDYEQESLRAADFIPVRLGPRVLRTETAALATIAILQALWGDISG